MKKGFDLKAPDDETTAFFNKRAKDTADELGPILFTDLYHELNCGPLPIEYSVILWRRLYYEVFEFCLMVESFKLNPELQNRFSNFLQDIEWVEGGPGYTPVVKFIYNAFKRELEEYKKKHKEDLSQTISKAKGGDRRALFRLVKWDKTWLEWDFVHKCIMTAQYANDRVFFESLADAIRKKSGIKKGVKEERIFSVVRLFAKRYELSKDEGLKKLHEDLDKAGAFDMGDDVSDLFEFKYFTKQLRRHRII
jgi:hypothetical protein